MNRSKFNVFLINAINKLFYTLNQSTFSIIFYYLYINYIGNTYINTTPFILFKKKTTKNKPQLALTLKGFLNIFLRVHKLRYTNQTKQRHDRNYIYTIWNVTCLQWYNYVNKLGLTSIHIFYSVSYIEAIYFKRCYIFD